MVIEWTHRVSEADYHAKREWGDGDSAMLLMDDKAEKNWTSDLYAHHDNESY